MKYQFIITAAVLLSASVTYAQSFGDVKKQYEHYDTVSPLAAPSINTKQVIKPETGELTPKEEELAVIKAKEAEEQKAKVEKVYLDTDYQFFQALAVPVEDDELDKASKQDEVARTLEKQKITEVVVKSEIKQTAPKALTKPAEVIADTRKTALLKTISTNTTAVRACIMENKKSFKGSGMTLAWEVDATGKVSNVIVKATDMDNKAIQDCIQGAIAKWNFDANVDKNAKNTQIEYTYKFISPTSKVATGN